MPSQPPLAAPQPLWRSPALAVATGLFVGLFPFAPGTIGALWGLPVTILIQQLPGFPLQIAVIAVLNLIGIPLCTRAARQLGRKDPGAVVWDEIMTMPLTFLGVDPALVLDWRVAITGYLLHRVFDISKIPPARQLELLPEGLGIMADDLAAGVYSCLVLHLLLFMHWIPGVVTAG